jgi:hypothetical protein
VYWAYSVINFHCEIEPANLLQYIQYIYFISFKLISEKLQYLQLILQAQLSYIFISELYKLGNKWQTGWQGFNSWQRQGFFSSLYVQTTSRAHPVTYPMGTVGPFPGGKVRPGRDADNSPHLVPRSTMYRSYTSSSSWRLHGMQRNTFTSSKILQIEGLVSKATSTGIPKDSCVQKRQ